MSEVSTTIAKLSGIHKSLNSVMEENVSRARSSGELLTRSNFSPELVEQYFKQAAVLIKKLTKLLPELYGDFHEVISEPDTKMAKMNSNEPDTWHYSRTQCTKLIRDIEQIFELRANSQLEQPKKATPERAFISHGSSAEWRKVQAFVEKDVGMQTLELAQEPNVGRTIIEKLIESAEECSSAIIVMTGDDFTDSDESRVRENVMHEIGFFQGAYGRNLVILLHEEGVNIPTNLSGVAYVPFPKNNIEASFHVLQRELKAIYKK